ncbi:MAG: hypothetical protein HRU20_08765 [Pseudomonadales bacterium]|nr:hypothetical protein [Pseudomonadales bacterium]
MPDDDIAAFNAEPVNQNDNNDIADGISAVIDYPLTDNISFGFRSYRKINATRLKSSS